MSDDDLNDSNRSNAGITLPEGVGATYSISLSPLFVNHNGRNEAEGAINYRGRLGRLWSSKSTSINRSYFLDVTSNDIAPSHYYWRYLAYSLRCLVSTNNG